MFVTAGGKGAYAVIDPVAGPFAEQLTKSVRNGGTYMLYSRLGGMTAHVGIADLLYRGVTVCSDVSLCLHRELCFHREIALLHPTYIASTLFPAYEYTMLRGRGIITIYDSP